MAAGDAVEHRVKRDGWLDWGEVGRATEGMDPNLVLVEAGRRVSDLALSDELSEIVSASLGDEGDLEVVVELRPWDPSLDAWWAEHEMDAVLGGLREYLVSPEFAAELADEESSESRVIHEIDRDAE